MTEEDLIDLATAFRDVTAEELATAEEPSEFYRVTRRAHLRIDQLVTAMTEDDQVPVACCAGCGYCCHLKVETRAQDVLALAAWIDEHFSAEDRAALLAKAQAHAARLAGLTLEQQLRINFPCPALKDGSCSVYAGRPATCRIVHSTDVKPCIYAYEHPEDLDAKSGADIEMRVGLRVANDGVVFAFREAGYDTELYHLSTALTEAMTDPEAEPRWRAKQRTFSDAALARPPEPATETAS